MVSTCLVCATQFPHSQHRRKKKMVDLIVMELDRIVDC